MPGLAPLAVFCWAYASGQWETLRLPAQPDLPFLDLRAVTHAASCAAVDPGWSIESESCDPLGRGYNYPEAWARGFAALGWTSDVTVRLGFGLAILIAACLIAVSVLAQGRTPTLGRAVVLTACSVSPPVLLLMERGNIDGFVLAIVVAAAAFAAAGWTRLAAVAVVVAGALKIFPLAAFPVVLARGRAGAGRALAVLGAGTVVALIAVVPQMALIAGRTPQSEWSAFGSSVLPYAANRLDSLGWDDRTVRLIGWAVAAACAAAAIAFVKSPAMRPAWQPFIAGLRSDPVAYALVAGGGGSLAAAYAVGGSADYRLAFAAPLVGGLIRAAGRANPFGWLLAGVLVVSMFASYPFQLYAPPPWNAVSVVGDGLLAFALPMVVVATWDAAVELAAVRRRR